MRALRRRYGRSHASNFRTHGADQWGASIAYAGGERHDWGIRQLGSLFQLEVRTSEGTYRYKGYFHSLADAERYANRYIERADGPSRLARAKKQFRQVRWT